jgi:hypothetical protein
MDQCVVTLFAFTATFKEPCQERKFEVRQQRADIGLNLELRALFPLKNNLFLSCGPYRVMPL